MNVRHSTQWPMRRLFDFNRQQSSPTPQVNLRNVTKCHRLVTNREVKEALSRRSPV